MLFINNEKTETVLAMEACLDLALMGFEIRGLSFFICLY
jgi:hypothetical protein